MKKKILSLGLVLLIFTTLFVPLTVPAANAPFADFYFNRPGSGHAIIVPVYDGMSVTLGQPALIDASRSTGRWPSFRVINTQSNVTLSGRLLNASGTNLHTITARTIANNGTITIPDSVAITAGTTYRVEFELARTGQTTFWDTFFFTAISSWSTFRSQVNANHSNNANVANVHPDRRDGSVWPAVRLENGRLVYYPDYKGNRLMDYSYAGYRGGGVPIPFVDNFIHRVAPNANNQTDMRTTIQNAINTVAARPLVDGFRGVVLLEPGVFRISGPLTINASGVVIRGSGTGSRSAVNRNGNTLTVNRANEDHQAGVTKLIATWRPLATATIAGGHSSSSNDTGTGWREGLNQSMIQFSGTSPSTTGTVNIVDQYIGTGQNAIRVTSTSGYAAGQLIRVQKATNTDWVRAMYMDRIDGANTWLNAAGTGTAFGLAASEHRIRSISGNTIILEDGLPDNIDMRWGTSTVSRISTDNRITNVGIENLQMISNFANTQRPTLTQWGFTYQAFNDENHCQRAVNMSNVRDGWARNYITYHFDRAFESTGRSRNITVQDIDCLDPSSQMAQGERRYSFYISGQASHIFHQRLFSRYARHAFSTAAYLPGPNVFYRSNEEYPSNTSEPHFRWSTGGLFDNIHSRIAIQNRWSWGTSHGHSGANYVMYNCSGAYQISQPQTTPNFLIGFGQTMTTPSWAVPSGHSQGALGTDASGRKNFGFSGSNNMNAAGLNGGQVPNLPPYTLQTTRKVNPGQDSMPDSLYVQQLIDRTNNPGVTAVLDHRTVSHFTDTPVSPIPNPNNDLARGAGSVFSNITVTHGNQNTDFHTTGGRASVFAFDGNPDGRLDGQINYAGVFSSSAINGNPDSGGTFWSTSNNTTPAADAWIRLDYGSSPVTFSRIEIYPRDFDGQVTSYRIETSDNGTSWTSRVHSTTPLVRVQSGTPLRDTPRVHNLDAPVTARFVRFTILSHAASGMYGIRGLELYGAPPPVSTARSITGGGAADAPRNGDLAYGATAAGSSSIPRAVSGGDTPNAARLADHAFNDSYSTDNSYWQLAQATASADTWLAVDYRSTTAGSVTFDRVVVQGRQEARPTAYSIDVQAPGSSSWTTVFTENGNISNGLTTGDNRGTEVSFSVPITAGQVRIRVTASTGANNNVQLSRFALYRRGDVNGDGLVNASDVTMLRGYIAAEDKTAFRSANPAFCLHNADLNGDGFINSADITLLRRRIAATNPANVPFGPRP
jgi:hypothetical protein